MTARPTLLTRPFALAWGASFFEGLAFALFIHFSGFLSELGAGEVEIGALFAVTAASSVVVRPAIGKALDVRGRRLVIVAGNAANAVIIATYLTVAGIGLWIYVIRIIHGITQAMAFTALFTYAADIVPAERRTEGLALFGVSGLLPIAIAGLIGDLVLAVAGYDEFFVTATAFAVAALLLSLGLREHPDFALGGAARHGFASALRQTSLLPLWWIVGAFAVVLTGYFTFLKTFVLETGIGSVGLFFAVYAAIAIAVRLVGARLPDRIGPRRVLVPAMGSLAAGFVVLAIASGNAHIALAGMLCGAGHGYSFPILFGLVVTRARAGDRGSATAIFTSLLDLGLLVGGPVLGLIIAVAGYPAMFLAAAAFLVAATALYAVWDRPYPTGAPDPAAQGI